jgi:hypothetical protein
MRRAWWALLGGVLVNVHVARADPSPTEIQAARDLFAKAEKDEDGGQWTAALEKLRRAGTVKMTPGIRFHIALCEEKLNQLVAALADYTAAEQAAREQNNKDVSDAIAEPLRVLRIRVPTLTLDVPPTAGAEVELDGKNIGAGLWGAPLPVEPGMHRVQARATGKQPFTTQVQLGEREAQTATIKWVAAASVAITAPDPFENAPSGSHEAHEGSGMRWGAFAATLSAAALFGFGVGAYVAADGAQQTLFQQCPTLTNCDSLRQPVRTWDWVALTSWIAAAGVTTVAVVLWLTPSHHTQVRARIELRPLGLALSGSF